MSHGSTQTANMMRANRVSRRMKFALSVANELNLNTNYKTFTAVIKGFDSKSSENGCVYV